MDNFNIFNYADTKQLLSLVNGLLQNFPDSVYYKALPDFRFVAVNQEKASHYGATPEDMIGKTDFDYLPLEEAKKAFEADRMVVETGEPIKNIREKRTRQDGSLVYLSATKIPWRDEHGEIIGVMGISRDITEREIFNDHILTMLKSASHDFQSPLIAIGAELKLLLRGYYDPERKPPAEGIKNCINDVLKRITVLSERLRQYLLKSAVMGGGFPNSTIFDLRNDVIIPVIESLSEEIESQEIWIDNSFGGVPSDEITIEADKTWLEIIYRNLLTNAIRFAGKDLDPSGNKMIALGLERTSYGGKNFYKLNVYNTGPPVPDELKEKIFNQFESDGGTGIGLPICRNLARKHGGEMWYETALDGHPNFVFTIPCP